MEGLRAIKMIDGAGNVLEDPRYARPPSCGPLHYTLQGACVWMHRRKQGGVNCLRPLPAPRSYTNRPWLSQLQAEVPELRKSSITRDGSKALPEWPENEDVLTRGVSRGGQGMCCIRLRRPCLPYLPTCRVDASMQFSGLPLWPCCLGCRRRRVSQLWQVTRRVGLSLPEHGPQACPGSVAGVVTAEPGLCQPRDCFRLCNSLVPVV